MIPRGAGLFNKWKLVSGADDPDAISRRGAEADLFQNGRYSGASSVFRSYAAFVSAKGLRMSKAKDGGATVAAIGVGLQILSGFIANKGDVTYDLTKMNGQKCPSDDEATYKNKAAYKESGLYSYKGNNRHRWSKRYVC